MRDPHQIRKLWSETRRAEKSAVLATVVKTRGSSYRLPGARLLLTDAGQRAGSISGGCLEDDLVKKAWWLTEGNARVIRKYDTTSDGEIVPEFGLGCSGIIYVLLERLTPESITVLDTLESVRVTRKPAAIAHVLAPTDIAGRRVLLQSDGSIDHDLSDPELVHRLHAFLTSAVAGQRSQELILPDGVEAFIEVLQPPIRLLVFGAGDDAVPVTDLAQYLGWEVFVFDGRAHYARRDRFPLADEVVAVSASLDLAAKVDAWSAGVIMTHSYSQDLSFLRQLSTAPLPYLGILGPRKRTIQLLSDAGLDASRAPETLHSPMGLDIGADGADQVALAIIAEIQATLNGRSGGLLRERAGSIHSREEVPSGSDEFWVRTIVCA